jgi:hypothetical protein
LIWIMPQFQYSASKLQRYFRRGEFYLSFLMSYLFLIFACGVDPGILPTLEQAAIACRLH